MKIAIVRGRHLNKFEMQNYEPLKEKFELIGYSSKRPSFETDIIDFPVKKLRAIEDIRDKLPGPIRKALAGYLYKKGYSQHLFGLEKELTDKDIAHVAELRANFSYQAVKAKKDNPRLRVVNTVWQNIPYVRLPTPFGPIEFNRKIIEKIIEGTDAFIAVTKRAKEALILEGVPEEKIQVIPVGVDLERFKPRERDNTLMEKLGIGKENFVVLHIGRAVWEKGAEYLLHAFKLLNIRNSKLIIIGRGPEYGWIDELVRRYRLEGKVIHIERVPYMEIHRYYSVADVFVLPSAPIPSWQEQFGMVFVEAMASGIPIVAGYNGSIPEVVGDAGILVPPADFHELAEVLRILAEDEKLREKLGRAGRERAEREFNPKKIAEKIKSVYLSLS
ncbi:glycosyltransferase [Thermococcus sp.]